MYMFQQMQNSPKQSVIWLQRYIVNSDIILLDVQLQSKLSHLK